MLFQLLSNLVLISLEEKLTRHLAVHLVLHMWSRRAPTYHTIWTHTVSTWRWGRATLIHSSRTHWHILCGRLKSNSVKKVIIQQIYSVSSHTYLQLYHGPCFFHLLLFCFTWLWRTVLCFWMTVPSQFTQWLFNW